MSYINREKLLRRCQKLATEYWKLKVTASAESIMNQFIDFVKEAPDEVVVCKDCKYAHLTDDGICKYCDQWKDDDGLLLTLYVSGDFHCGFGDQKDEIHD